MKNVKTEKIMSDVSFGSFAPGWSYKPYTSGVKRYPGNINDVVPGPSKTDNTVNHIGHSLWESSSFGSGGASTSVGCFGDGCHSNPISNPFPDPYSHESGEWG